MDFLAVDADFGRRGDAEPNLVSFHGRDRDGDAAIDKNLLANFP